MSKIYAQKKLHEAAGVDSTHQTAPAFSNQAMLDILKSPENVRAKPLSQEMNERMSQHFGVSLSGVKVFENENLNQLGETAFAHGNEIHVAKGQYAPGTAQGQALLMHEAAHVVQQGMGLAHSAGEESAALEAQAQSVQAGDSMGNISGFSMPVATSSAPIQGSGGRIRGAIKRGWQKFKNLFSRSKQTNTAPAAQPTPAPAPAREESLPFDFMAMQKRDGVSHRAAEYASKIAVIERLGKKANRDASDNLMLNDAMVEQHDLWKKTLTDDELASVINYTTTSYRDINDQLRLGGDDEAVQQEIDNVSSAVQKSYIPSDMILHRGVGPEVLGKLMNFDGSGMNRKQLNQHLLQHRDSLIGRVIQDKGFSSTSIDSEVARRFARKNNGAQLQIHAKKGSKGAYLDPISEAIGEREVLLNKGQKFRIDSIDENKLNPEDLQIILSLVNDDDEGQLK